MVTVLDVELERNRISLSMKNNVDQPKRYGKKQAKPQNTK
jgi:ribosomal protein S1